MTSADHMTQPDLAFLNRLADVADAVTLPLFRTRMDIDIKGTGMADIDPVTAADRGAELALRALIGEEFPAHGISGEEYGISNAGADMVWHLDPVDGTRQFIAGMPLWGTLIGLAKDGDPLMGMISQPYTRERFYGGPEGALHTSPHGIRPLRTRPCSALADATLFTTTPNLFTGAQRTAYDAVERQVRLARYGTDCYAYGLLALGFVDIVIECGLKDHDIVPLVPIIEAAGGAAVDWRGQRMTRGGDVVAVGDPRLLEAILPLLA